jgi:5-deoxy-5-amino-3-dehydroquinate synthase
MTSDLSSAPALTRVPVDLGDRSYEVVIGHGARHLVSEFIPATARRAAIVTQRNIGVAVDPGIPSQIFYMEDGEEAKSLATIAELSRAFVSFGLTRADVVIAVGGGVVTDAAGFAAACYHRGVGLINVSTSLLGQVDAAIGGKTAVNLPEGKNLVGAFWQPIAVLCDTETLVTLPERERRSGCGEMAKYAFLGVENLDQLSIEEQIAACARLKAEVVSEDEREGNRRMHLNYGHTLAHALEAAGFADGPGREGIDLRHGEAVAIGLLFAAHLARLLGRIDDARVARHYEIVRSYGLPTALPVGVNHGELVRLMGHDKKATDGLLFILDGPRGAEIVRGVPEEAVLAALALVSVAEH